VVKAGYTDLGGWSVTVDHGRGLQSYYGHLQRPGVVPGASVDMFSVIGWVDSTGRSTGPHLHLTITVDGKPVDPQPYLEGKKK
jgi:murein DD-endopeptidase MepM/ murein hydrolase activator NlpD